jgi:hypothetical protein
MGMLKHLLDDVAAEMGVADPNDPAVVAEAQRRLDEALKKPIPLILTQTDNEDDSGLEANEEKTDEG